MTAAKAHIVDLEPPSNLHSKFFGIDVYDKNNHTNSFRFYYDAPGIVVTQINNREMFEEGNIIVMDIEEYFNSLKLADKKIDVSRLQNILYQSLQTYGPRDYERNERYFTRFLNREVFKDSGVSVQSVFYKQSEGIRRS